MKQRQSAQDVLAAFLLADIDLPDSRATKDELWVWIRAKSEDMKLIRRAFLNSSAEKMVAPVDLLHEAYDAMHEAMCDRDEERTSAAVDRLNNIINGMLP